MARDDQRHGVRSVGHPDGPLCVGSADAPRELSVRDSRTDRDLPKLRPDLLLETRAPSLDCQCVERADLAVEIGLQHLVHTEPVTAHRLRRRVEGRAPNHAVIDGCTERAEWELHYCGFDRHAFVVRPLRSPYPDTRGACPDP